MANEITITTSLRYAKNKASSSLSTNFLADQTGDKYVAEVQAVGTDEEVLQKGDIGTIGYVNLRNMDAANFVSVGTTTNQPSLTLKAGKGCLIYAGTNNVYLKADTAPVEVEYLAIEV